MLPCVKSVLLLSRNFGEALVYHEMIGYMFSDTLPSMKHLEVAPRLIYPRNTGQGSGVDGH